MSLLLHLHPVQNSRDWEPKSMRIRIWNQLRIRNQIRIWNHIQIRNRVFFMKGRAVLVHIICFHISLSYTVIGWWLVLYPEWLLWSDAEPGGGRQVRDPRPQGVPHLTHRGDQGARHCRRWDLFPEIRDFWLSKELAFAGGNERISAILGFLELVRFR